MSMIARNNSGSSIKKLESGVYVAISSAIIDLGLQDNKNFNKVQRKFMLIWNVVGEEVEIDGELLPRTISKEYSYSLHDKSTLRKDLQAWRNKPFTEEELKGFNLLKILNKPCQMQIILEEKNGNKYNNISSIMALNKGQEVKQLDVGEYYHFDMEDQTTWDKWNRIPEWIQNKIKLANNFESSNLKRYIETGEYNTTEITVQDDDLPF